MRPVRLALLGATGLVGQTTLSVLEEWDVALAGLKLYASAGSAGRVLTYRGKSLDVLSIDRDHIEADFAILALSAELSRIWAPRLTAHGIRVIDHSSAFRMDDDVPLVIPEINARTIGADDRLVANPNCSASIVVMPLAPLERKFGLRRVILSTYQSVSGAGAQAVEEYRAQLHSADTLLTVFPQRIAGNLFPEIGPWGRSGYSGEEQKVVDEIKKILGTPYLHVSATTVRVPVYIGHSAAVSVELREEGELREVMECLADFPGLVCDGSGYSTPLECEGKQEVHVGRVRLDPDDSRWLHFWVVGDNLRKGAASNAIQILQHWAER